MLALTNCGITPSMTSRIYFEFIWGGGGVGGIYFQYAVDVHLVC